MSQLRPILISVVNFQFCLGLSKATENFVRISRFDRLSQNSTAIENPHKVMSFRDGRARVLSVTRRAVRYPAIVFWTSLTGVPTGLLSALIFHLLTFRTLPSLFLTDLFIQAQCRVLLQLGFALSALGLVFVADQVHRFVSYASEPFFSRAVIDCALFVVLASLLLLLSGVCDPHSAIHFWARVLYLRGCSILHGNLGRIGRKGPASPFFWFRDDSISAIAPTAIVLLSFCAKVWAAAGRIAGAIEVLGFLAMHFRFIGSGITVLGARFVPIVNYPESWHPISGAGLL
jgi:hypothetical protein